MKTKSEILLAYLKRYYADARCSLIFDSDFECLVAISLSAQTTDEAVNKVTASLFRKYKDADSLSKASIEDIEDSLHSLGLYRTKAKNLHALSNILSTEYGGKVPHDFEILKSLPGVGEKTAAVFLLERANYPSIPVDTHIKRISERLGYASKEDPPSKIRTKLEKEFPEDDYALLHHGLIAFGRNECHAKKPVCSRCDMKSHCRYFKKTSSTIDK